MYLIETGDTEMTNSPITYATFHKFEAVAKARELGRDDVKKFQREAVKAYLDERKSRSTAFMIRFSPNGGWR